MNNYSADSTTEEIIEFLEGILTKGNKQLATDDAIHQNLFDDVKEWTVNTTDDDDDRIVELLENEGRVIVYDYSNYNNWQNLSWFAKQFTPEPQDDRETSHKAQVKLAGEAARYVIHKTLDNLETLTHFYDNKFRLSVAGNVLPFDYQSQEPGYKLTLDIIGSKLPEDMWTQHSELTAFKNNLKKIEEMLQTLTVYEFNTVTVEESMLQTIDNVCRYNNTTL